MTRLTLLVATVLALTSCAKTSTTPDAGDPYGAGSSSTSTTVQKPACATWAGQQRGTGVSAATGSVVAQRDALYAAGGGIRAVSGKYYAAYFPSGFASASKKRVLVDLHGTGGAPEAEWSEWKSSIDARGWAYLGLKYVDDSGTYYDDEATIYSHLTSMLDDVAASCDVGSVSLFLAGYSRGSAQSYPVEYLDLKGRRLFTAVANNSGAWDLGGSPTPTLQAIATAQNRTALAGARFWMYCGDRDMSRGWPMCDEMKQAREWLQTYGATIAAFYEDPAGLHGGLTKNSDALAQMFAYFEGL